MKGRVVANAICWWFIAKAISNVKSDSPAGASPFPPPSTTTTDKTTNPIINLNLGGGAAVKPGSTTSQSGSNLPPTPGPNSPTNEENVTSSQSPTLSITSKTNSTTLIRADNASSSSYSSADYYSDHYQYDWDDSYEEALDQTIPLNDLGCQTTLNHSKVSLLDAIHECDQIKQSLIFVDETVSAANDTTMAKLFPLMSKAAATSGTTLTTWVLILRADGNWTYSYINFSKSYEDARQNSLNMVTAILAKRNTTQRGAYLMDYIRFFNRSRAVACTTCRHAKLGHCSWPGVLHGAGCHAVNRNATGGISDMYLSLWGCKTVATNKSLVGKLAPVPDAWEHSFFALFQDYLGVAEAWISMARVEANNIGYWFMDGVLLSAISYRGDFIVPLSTNVTDTNYFVRLVRSGNYSWISVPGADNKVFPSLCTYNKTACKCEKQGNDVKWNENGFALQSHNKQTRLELRRRNLNVLGVWK